MASVDIEGAAQRAADRAVELAREQIRDIRKQAWDEGYRACYEGKQRHNPYIQKEND